jgi:ABC-type multidrug transport system fused ATPase/permease subunit
MDAVVQAAKIASLHEFIQEMPDKYSTLVGERGVRLSGGQRQRVGIARALYHNPDVIIFDEATNALDSITEDIVFSAIAEISKFKTIITIAHRLSTVRDCDVIYLLDEGKIVAQGSYRVLLDTNAQFRAMAKDGSVELK